MLVSEAIQYLNSFSLSASDSTDEDRIEKMLQCLNLAHYDIYKRFWNTPIFEILVEFNWDINLTVFKINTTDIQKIISLYSDTISNLEKNIDNQQYLEERSIRTKIMAGNPYLLDYPAIEKYTLDDGSEAERYVATAILIPSPKKLVLERSNPQNETATIPYNDIFFDALLAKAMVYHFTTPDGNNQKFNYWVNEFERKVKYLDGYYISQKR